MNWRGTACAPPYWSRTSHSLWNLKPDSGYFEDGDTLNAATLQALDGTQPKVPETVRAVSA